MAGGAKQKMSLKVGMWQVAVLKEVKSMHKSQEGPVRRDDSVGIQTIESKSQLNKLDKSQFR